MSFFTDENRKLADEIVARYPRRRSAMIPLLHLAQEQAGWITTDAMEEIATLVDSTPAEVLGTGSFYEMFKFHPVGKYVVNVCTNISCQLLGGEELLEHAAEKLGVTIEQRPIALDEEGGDLALLALGHDQVEVREVRVVPHHPSRDQRGPGDQRRDRPTAESGG